ncbi:type III pantothenate kinase [Acholeplasma sp. OttesenSCG-928-E16]|nr:type III pantothenate kinase [Acholeplasma sp. OttesenSCG-928-E16]
MILLIDIGNTTIGIGLAFGNEIKMTYRLTTNTSKSFDEYYVAIKDLIKVEEVTDIAISSVVPRVTESFVKLSKKFFNINPLIVAQGTKTGINIKTENPKEVGADLICDAAGIVDNVSASLIIDLGTAIKYIYVKDKTIGGVIISPGIGVAVKALVGSTALLPDIDVLVPKNVLGTNTVACMQSGITYGTAAQIDGLIERIKEEVKQEDLKVYITGGLSSFIYPIIKTKAIYDSKIVLKGLLNIYYKNQR